MAQDIVGSLFGVSPNAILNQQVNSEMDQAINFANLSPAQQANYGGMLAGQMFGRGVASLLGAEDPRLKQANQIEQVKQWIAQSGVDMNTTKGLAQAAQYAQSIGATEGAMYLGQQAQRMKAVGLEQRQTELGIQAKETEIKNREGLQQALANMPENIDRASFIKTILPFVGNSSDAIKLASSRYGFDATEDATTTQALNPGDGMPYIVGTDNVGRVKLSNGRVIPRASYDKAEESYKAEDTLYTMINNISDEDVENAYGSTMDYTEVPFLGRAVPDTTEAQMKIKGAAIQDTLQKLGPLKGATSDREFETIRSSFPKFDKDPEVMRKWIADAKAYLEKRMKRGIQQYGFDREATAPQEPQQPASKYKVGDIKKIGNATYVRTEQGWVQQ